MLFAAPLFALLTGCQPATGPTDMAADVAADAPSKAPADKNGKSKKGKKTAKNGKSNGHKTAEAPLGVAGPVTGTLALVEVPPPPAAEGAVTPATTTRKTEAKLAMKFSDGQSSDVSLGTMEGDCDEIPPEPVGPEKKTPLWSVRCVGADGKPTDVHIVQNDAMVSVLREVEVEGQPMQLKPMTRVRLAEGASLQKG